jgi:hypothetical protein
MKKSQEVPGRPAIRRLVAALFVLGGVAIWASCAATEIQAWQLDSHGVRTTAGIEQVQVLKNSDNALVSFSDRSGIQQQEWVEAVPHGVAVGDRLSVVYDPGGPSTIQDLPVMESSRWSAPEGQVPGGLIFAGFGLLVFRRGLPVGLGGSVQTREWISWRRRQAELSLAQ